MLSQELEKVGEQTLEIISDIAKRAEDRLKQSGYSSSVISNSFTDNALLTVQCAKDTVERDSWFLVKEPAFIRIDLEDVDGKYCRSLYVSRAAPPSGLSQWGQENIDFVSYRAPMGRVASLACGSDFLIKDNEYYVGRKIKFTPQQVEAIWDCFGVEIETEDNRFNLDSFRQLLDGLADKGIDVETFLQDLQEFDQSAAGKLKSLTKNIRSSMELRSQAALDQYQDNIFRLPINSQRIILGPPGTGKTTTLIKRLGQKLDTSDGILADNELTLLRKLGKGAKGFSDWIMFTPSDLLKSYLVRAFNYEGIAVKDNLQTWGYAKNIARQNLSILNSAKFKSAFTLDTTRENLKVEVVDDPREIYSALNCYIEQSLAEELKQGLEIVFKASDGQHEKVIEKLEEIIKSDSLILSKFKQLFELENQIKKIIEKEKETSEKIIKEQRNLLINRNPKILDDLAVYLASFHSEEEDDLDEETDFDDDEELQLNVSYDQRSKALAEYQKFLKALARNRYLKKSLKKDSKHAKLYEWLSDKLPTEEVLIQLGCSISLQNGLRRNLNGWKRLYQNPVRLYKKFRKDSVNRHFYIHDELDAKKITQAELDLLLLVTLRNIRTLLQEPYILRNIDEVKFQEIKGFQTSLFKDQVYVDEATDFSVLQLACMQAMTTPLLNSFFACGDFNQRLTTHGIKDLELIEWISSDIKIERINTIYRQSPTLNKFTHAVLDLMNDSDADARSKLPKFIDFDGLNPVMAEYLCDLDQAVEWITDRVAEIESLVNQNNMGEQIFPSIVVLVKDEGDVLPMTTKLNEYLDELNLKAVACLQGQSVGEKHDVRVCSIEYIKGLEFEAVFFVGIDQLIEMYPQLYRKFLYVGSTRAANYLGVTCSEELPGELESLRTLFTDSWDINKLKLV